MGGGAKLRLTWGLGKSIAANFEKEEVGGEKPSGSDRREKKKRRRKTGKGYFGVV